MFCHNCGSAVKDGEKYCSNCGELVIPPQTIGAAPVPVEEEMPKEAEAVVQETQPSVLRSSFVPPTPEQPTYVPLTPERPTYVPPTPEQPTYVPPTPERPTYVPPMPEQPTYVPPTPEQPVSAKKKKKTGLIIALIAVAAALLLAGAFCVWYFLIRIPPVEHITLSETTIEFAIGEEKQPSYTIMPEKANKKEVFWKSTNDSVATVDGNGKIIAKGIGVCTITASVENQTASVEVIVLKPELSESEILLGQGEEHMLVCSIYPESVKNKTVEWKSSDESIATVGQNGVVQAKECGQCTVTASVDNQSVTAEVIVMKIELSDNSLSLCREAKHTLNCMIYPESLQDQTIEWASSDEKVATVDRNGVVCGIDGGTCTITATVGSQSVSATVEVKKINAQEAKIEGKWVGNFAVVGDDYKGYSGNIMMNDDLTGWYTLGSKTYDFTWQYVRELDSGTLLFKETDEDGTYDIYYYPENDYLVLDVLTDGAIFYKR